MTVDVELTTEQTELGVTVRRFLAENAPLPWVRRMMDDERGTTDEVWRGLAGLGVLGLLAPGSGAGMVEMGVVLQEVGRAVHPGPVASAAVGGVALLGLCGEVEAAALVGGGELVAVPAIYEPRLRWEWRDPQTAVEGDRVTGVKAVVADAMAADAFVVTTSSGPVWVDAPGEGVTIEPLDSVDPTRRSATVRFERATGRPLDGPPDAVPWVVDLLRVASVVDALGAAEAAFEMAVAYAKEREQFGVPIGSFQAVQHLLADSLLRLEQSRASAFAACRAADGSPEELHRAATIAKAYAGEALYRVGADAIQVFGGVGYTWEHDVHLFYKRVLSAQHEHGGEDEHLEELARLVIDRREGQPT